MLGKTQIRWHLQRELLSCVMWNRCDGAVHVVVYLPPPFGVNTAAVNVTTLWTLTLSMCLQVGFGMIRVAFVIVHVCNAQFITTARFDVSTSCCMPCWVHLRWWCAAITFRVSPEVRVYLHFYGWAQSMHKCSILEETQCRWHISQSTKSIDMNIPWQ